MPKPNSHLQKVQQFHDHDAQQYTRMRYHTDSCEGLAYTTRRRLVLDMLNRALSGRQTPSVLDIGCGPGILTPHLLDKGVNLLSTDLSIEMLRQAEQRALQTGRAGDAAFAVTDASSLPVATNRIDIALCIGVLYYVKDYRPVLSEIHRVLKPGGQAIVQINKMRWPNLYKNLVPLYHGLKSTVTGKKYDQIDFDFNYFDYRTFITDAQRQGFEITQIQHFDYRIPFIDLLLPRLSVKLGKQMYANRHKRPMKYLSFGLLITISK